MPDALDAILLCGGAGLRLRSVIGDTPKGMAEVAGRPFLEVLLRQLRRYEFGRVILAVGYGMHVIRSRFGTDAFGMRLEYSVESSPLGTGGAVRQAADSVKSDSVLIMNGDSYTDVDLCRVVKDHRTSRAEASVVVVPADGRSDCGTIRLGPDGRVITFEEKKGTADANYVNAGIYVVARRLLYDIPPGIQVSIEREVFPRWLDEGYDIRASVTLGRCVDIGTPERYQLAQDLLQNTEATEGVAH